MLISGDLTQKGSTREFELLDSSLLNSLLDYLRNLGSRPALLAVPGPHDFDVASARPGLFPSAGSLRVVMRRVTLIGSVARAGFAPFVNWFSAWRLRNTGPAISTFREGLLPGDFSASLLIGDLRLGVIGLNSSFAPVDVDALIRHESPRGATRSGDRHEHPGLGRPA